MNANSEIKSLLSDIDEEVETVISELLRIEEGKIHMASPLGIHDEILDMVERVVK